MQHHAGGIDQPAHTRRRQANVHAGEQHNALRQHSTATQIRARLVQHTPQRRDHARMSFTLHQVSRFQQQLVHGRKFAEWVGGHGGI